MFQFRFSQFSNRSVEYKLGDFASTAIASNYLSAVKQLRRSRKEKIEKLISSGYNLILSMFSGDGSYKLPGYGDSDKIWINAFIAKNLRIASSIFEIDEDHIEIALRFLATQQKSSGAFEETSDSVSNIIKGGVSNPLTMTAFVMIAFLENSEISAEEFKDVVTKGLKFIDTNTPKISNNFDTAIAAYTFVLGNHNYSQNFLRELQSHAITEDDKMHWNKNFASDSIDEDYDASIMIEIASYALLAFFHSGDYTTSMKIMNWLTSQRIDEEIYATQGLLVGIQAITDVTEKFYHPGIDMNVTLLYGNKEKNFQVSGSGFKTQHFELPPNFRSFQVSAQGKGKALLTIWHSFSTKIESLSDAYEVTLAVEAARYGGIFWLTVCSKFPYKEHNKNLNDIIMEVNFPSGYAFDPDSTEDLVDAGVKVS